MAAIVGASFGALWPAHGVCAEESMPPDHPMMRDRFVLGVGVSRTESSVTASLNDSGSGLGSIIDFEDDLGLDRNNVIAVLTFGMRVGDRWRLDVEYFTLNRDNVEHVDRTLDWGRLSIPLNATIRSNFNVEDIRVSVGYSFFRRTDKEVGVGLGAHVMSLDATVSADDFGRQNASVNSAPLPVFIFYARMALTDRWLLNMRGERLSLDTGDIDGSIFNSEVDFVYQPWRHFNVGVGYRDINLEVTSSDETWRGKAQVRQNGPMLFVSSTF
ncbi:MAG TPA: hypothetical protein VKB34_00260 [Povalibacter sp.]|nr:hypothetical protein [Povalibacter sp.]